MMFDFVGDGTIGFRYLELTQMHLQFPNARLFIHNLISNEQVSGPSAIIQAAYEFGLIPLNSSTEMECTCQNNGHCACFTAAKDILRRHFQSKIYSGQLEPKDLDAVWSNIERRARRYEQALLKKYEAKQDQCKKIAPALFDLMLQEITHYS